MKKKKFELTLEEARIVDNELYVAQCRMGYLNRLSADDPPPTEEQKEYKKLVDGLRVKIGRFVNQEVIENSLKKENKFKQRTWVE